MKRLVLPALFLFFSSVNLQAAQDNYRFEGLSSPVELKWDGHRSSIEKQVSFCIKLDSRTKYAVPSKIENTSLSYKLRLVNRGGSGSEFAASTARSIDKVPLELSLVGHGTLIPGKDTESLPGDPFCATKLNLNIKAQNLNQYAAGDYTATIQLIAENNFFRVVSDQDLIVNLSIPSLISINGDQQISLGDFSNADLKKSANFCVYRNGNGHYRLKAEGIGTPDNRFELQQQGGTSKLPYLVNINANNGGYQQASPKTPISGLRGNASLGCVKGGKNLDVQVSIPKEGAEKVYAGSYHGKLKIIVEVQ